MENTDIKKNLREVASNCIGVRLRVLDRIVTSLFDEALRPHGIRMTQLNILIAVASFGPVQAQELCKVLNMDTSTVSRTVARLRDRGWLESLPSGEGKNLLIRATTSGLEKIQEVYPSWAEAQQEAVELLGQQVVDTVTLASNKLMRQGMGG